MVDKATMAKYLGKYTLAGLVGRIVELEGVQERAPDPRPMQAEHINADGEFQSDKYLWCASGFVPMKITDRMAWPYLAAYAIERKEIDEAFGNDLLACLALEGFSNPEGYVSPALDGFREDLKAAEAKIERLIKAGDAMQGTIEGEFGLDMDDLRGWEAAKNA